MMERLTSALVDRYRIERELGQGGMATVFLAEDLRHKRRVAVKVLKPELAAVLGAERFVQEITTTASLQHPHILPLFDSGTADGFLYYVMPFIEGETLRDKLNRETQLGVDEAVRIASEVADALDYAHRRGVIHRDIKPENILLHDGRPMVADFGIALAVSAAAGGRMTETGLSLGTPHYMSPEQATADKEITGRSDVYSLASVLYEMLAGQPPHLGGSAQQIIMKIIAEPVDTVTRYRKSVPPNVAAALAKALEKLPADRFESARAFRDALSDRGFATVSTPTPRAPAPAARWNALTLAMAAVAFLSTAALVASRSNETTEERPVARYVIATAEDSAGSAANLRDVAISADGSRLAWIARDGTIWTRRRDALEVQKVETGDSPASAIALSPDGNEIAFTRVANLYVTSLGGGGTQHRADSVNGGWGLDWSDDGYLYFTRHWRIARVPAGGGIVTALPDETLPPPAVSLMDSGWVQILAKALPGGRGVVFLHAAADSDSLEFRAWDARRGRSHVVSRLSGREALAGAPVGYHDGYLFTVNRGRTLWATEFDLRNLDASSEPQPIVRDVLLSREVPAFDISSTGDAILATGAPAEIHLATVTMKGAISPLPVTAKDLRGVRVSPDGRRVAYGSDQHTFVHDLSIGSTRQLLSWSSWDPVWSRDGKRITIHATRPSSDTANATLGYDGFEIAMEGGGTPRRLFRHPLAEGPQAWTPDGKLIAHGLHVGGTQSDLYVISFEGDSSRVETLLDAPWAETMPSLSPDGKFIAYRANPSGTNAVFVRRFPDAAAGVWRVSEGVATEPIWSHDGRTLFYWEGQVLLAARIRTAPDFAVVSRNTVVRDIGYVPPTCCHSNYDVLPDGSGFIMVLNRGARGGTDRLTLVEGLVAELKRIDVQKR